LALFKLAYTAKIWPVIEARCSTIVDVPTTISATVLYIHGVQNYSMHVLLRNCGRRLNCVTGLLLIRAIFLAEVFITSDVLSVDKCSIKNE